MIGSYLMNAFFMLVILAILFVRSSYVLKQKQSRRRCLSLIGATAAYVVADACFILCDLSETCTRDTFRNAIFFFYVTYVMLPFVWHLFIRNYVGGTIFTGFVKKLEYIPLIIQLVLIVCTPFWGTVCYISEDGAYMRGSAFEFFSVLNFFYYVEPLLDVVIIRVKKEVKNERYLRQAVVISLVPLVAVFINTYAIPIYEIYPFQPFCSVIVALLAYFFIAAKDAEAAQNEQQQAIQDALCQAQAATQRANEASKVKSDFLSTMSHDIRTPMNAIINLTQLAQQEKDFSTVQAYLEKISVSGNFLLGLINDILDMSKIESGELTLNKERYSKKEFLTTIGTVINPLMDAKHLHFHVALESGGYIILADKVRFNQIFFNLLSNAAKFTPEGGDVWFESSCHKQANGQLEMKYIVRDNGIGISEEFMQHLFEPFAQEHSKLTDKTQGTGLGLAIVKRLVAAMNGTITAKSKLGEGTEFTIVLHADIVEEEEESDTPQESQTDLSGMRILLVEDNETNIYVAQIILESMGCVVTIAKNGQEAVDTFAASKPSSFDAVLMDVRMPVMDGLAATKAIRALERPDAKTTPIIAMTAEAFDEERKRTLDAGMNAHLSKPIDAKQLHDALAACIKH